ncbi:hypothetical protein A33O_15301 [Nitratireductor aquibiodomus RA22]|uniref:Uncharacterized protein n=1 Tax=Nitratireductor aquibiodomus RA22 TaxID=1189611 RepID=I5BVF1_9HYPH|nr:hypothetical protein A33O_15301 [Nitratireductor aquibiodomus RA22]
MQLSLHIIDYGRPEPHRHPSHNQSDEEPQIMGFEVGNIVRKLHPLRGVTGHRSKVQWRQGFGGPQIAIDAQPMALGEVEKHRCVAASGHHTPGLAVWLQAMFAQVFVALPAANPVLAKKNKTRSLPFIQDRLRTIQRA